ncbi:MAG: tetratricopeptide repeat protein [Elusimicrobiales bacterium]|jgi:hypothetical protein
MIVPYYKAKVQTTRVLIAAVIASISVQAAYAGLIPSLAASGGEQAAVQYLSNAPRSLALGGILPSWEPLRAETVLAQPGSLGLLDRMGGFVSQMNLFEDASFRAAGFSLPLRSHMTLGAGLYQLASGNADARNETGVITGSFKNQETLIRISCGRAILSGLSMGGNFDYMKMSLADASHGFAAFGLGGAWRPRGSDFSMDLTATNIASKVLGDTSDTLPLGINAGVSYSVMHDIAAIYFGAELKPGFGYETGIDWAIGRLLSLHLGRKNDINGVGLGANLGRNYHLGYTLNMHDLGMIHQMTLSITLGEDQTTRRQTDTEALYAEADKAMQNGKYGETLAALRKSEVYTPLPADRELVKKQLKKVVAGGVEEVSGSDNNIYLLRRGVQFYAGGNEDMARTAFQTVLARVPEHPVGRRLMALLPVLNAQGITLQQTADFSGSDPVRLKLYQIQRYYQQKEYDRALKECQELLVLNPREVLALVQMGSIYWTMGLKKEAEEAWKRAAEFEPDNPEVKKSIDFMNQEK